MHEFINHNRPEFVSSSEDGSQCVLIRDSASTYYRPAGCWSLSDGLQEGKHVVIKSSVWQLNNRVGTQLYPSSQEQYVKDNAGYVGWARSTPWTSADAREDDTEDNDDIPY